MTFIEDIKTLTGKEKSSPKQQGYTPLRKLLIVEDEKPLATVLADRFRDEGFSVFVGENGEEGLKLAVAHDPNVILLDLMMPVMDGKTMLHRLRSIPQCKTTPVIVLTNAGEIDNIKDTVSYNDATDFLIKSNETLDRIVKRVKDAS